jgi:hypothetical protein
MTGRDLVTDALQLIGAIAPGESLTAQEATEGLSALNKMLATWSTEGLLIYAITAESPITLTAGDATYTLGTSGDITTRPISIESALIRDGSTDYPVRILSLEEFSRISAKSVQSTIPYALYDDGGFPQRSVTLYPVPSAAKSLLLFTRRPLSSVSTLDTELSFPPGYEEALTYNLGVRKAPSYGRVLDPQVIDIAFETKAAIKRANHKPSYLGADEAVLPSGTLYNIHTGGYGP